MSDMRTVSYNDILNSINCGLNIFFEDDFVCGEADWCSTLYRLVRMNDRMFTRMNASIEEINKELAGVLNDIYKKAEPFVTGITNWNEVIDDDFEDLIEKMALGNNEAANEVGVLYEKICENDIGLFVEVFFKYGLACVVPQIYEDMFKEYICVGAKWKAFLVYNYYNADLIDELKNFVYECEGETATVCCIIDNDLQGENQAANILDVLENICIERSHAIVGAVVTSHERVERVTENIHVEYVSKDNLITLKPSILKSIYHYLLNVFKTQILQEASIAIKKASSHPAVAQYLIAMAQIEGISNYEILYQWIIELFEQGLSHNSNVPKLVSIANMLDVCSQVDDFDSTDSICDIEGFATFDYNVNRFYQPIAPGDVFIDNKGEIYILVGQACDMAMSHSRKRRNGLCELVKAKMEPITKLNKKTLDNLENMWVNNFKLNGNTSALKINYRMRYFMENEVLSLCSYSDEGICEIDLEKELLYEQKNLMQNFLLEYYSKLQTYFRAIKTLKDSNEENLAILLSDEYVDRVCTVMGYNENNTKLNFGVRRICRLKGNYTLFLHKLFLENKGRIPFETINMARAVNFNVEIYNGTKKINTNIVGVLTRDAKSINVLPWIISRETMNKILDAFAPNSHIKTELDEYSLETEKTTIPLDGSKKLVLTKKTPPKIYCTVE